MAFSEYTNFNKQSFIQELDSRYHENSITLQKSDTSLTSKYLDNASQGPISDKQIFVCCTAMCMDNITYCVVT